eukprot:6491822-Amphidinium_carterae.3
MGPEKAKVNQNMFTFRPVPHELTSNAVKLSAYALELSAFCPRTVCVSLSNCLRAPLRTKLLPNCLHALCFRTVCVLLPNCLHYAHELSALCS